MSRSNTIPKHARVLKSVEGVVVPGHATSGERRSLILYEGSASDGWKTNYETRPARWLLVRSRAPNGMYKTEFCKRFAGSRFEKADQEYERCAAYLTPDAAYWQPQAS